MNILYVTPDVVVPFYTGASTHVTEVAQKLAELGDSVHVLSRRLDRTQPRSESIDGVMVHRIYRGVLRPLPRSRYSKVNESNDSESGYLRSVYRAYLSTLFPIYAGLVSLALIRRYRVHVILERETAFGAGAVASAGSGVPLVLEVIGPRYSKKSVNGAKRVLAYTPSMVRGIQKSKLIFVEAGVDTQAFRPDREAGETTRRLLGVRPEAPLVGYVGTFQSWHGLDALLEALARLSEELPNLRCLLVGPYFSKVKEEAVRLGLGDRCIFTGPIPHERTGDFINACDVMVAPYNPSRSSLRSSGGIGFPIKILEYMACGKPIITSDLEPSNQIPGITGAALLIPPGDPTALKGGLLGLFRDRVKMNSMGHAGRSLVELRYSWSGFARNLHEILEEVVRDRPH